MDSSGGGEEAYHEYYSKGLGVVSDRAVHSIMRNYAEQVLHAWRFIYSALPET